MTEINKRAHIQEDMLIKQNSKQRDNSAVLGVSHSQTNKHYDDHYDEIDILTNQKKKQ